MIKVQNLVKRYGDKLALDHFNFNVKKGEIVGLLGPNGSGKSTSINCMLSLLNYDKGEIKIFDTMLTPTRYDLKAKIGIVPQDLAVIENLTVKENIDFFCGLYIADKQIRKQYVKEAITFVGLEEHKNVIFKNLSGGLKRRLNIACGIAHKPELIILDEPTVAVDAQSRNFILEGIKKLNQEGATIVYTSHYLEEVEQLCDTIVIMDNGKNIASGSLKDLQNQINTGEQILIKFTQLLPNTAIQLKSLDYLIDITENHQDIKLTFKKGTKPMRSVIDLIDKLGLSYESLSAVQPSLNDVFLTLTGKELRE